MKKQAVYLVVIIAVLSAFMMMLGNDPIYVYAADNTSASPSTHTVKGRYIASELQDDVYCVDIVWGGMEYDYTQSDRRWDTTNHKWVSTTDNEGQWKLKDGSSNTINLTNHSSCDVNVTIEYTPNAEEEDYNGVTMLFDNSDDGVSGNRIAFNMLMPFEGIEGATTADVTVTPVGDLDNATAVNEEYVVMGTITVIVE